MSEAKTLGIGIIGFGTVGSGVWKTLATNGDLIAARTGGIRMEIRKIAVRDLAKARDAEVPDSLFTTDWNEVVNDPSVDIVVELAGGTTTAFDIAKASLEARKPLITGNKALVAERGTELFSLSAQHQTPLHFEAAVAGGIPIIKALRESLVGNQLEALYGIINGTSNYILERMTDAGLDYQEALQEAMDLGYAEADPTLDVNGWDAAHKAIILATLAYGFPIDPQDVYVRGIEMIRPLDIRFAKEMGYVVKLISNVIAHDDGRVEIRTQPSFIPEKHILANVHGVFNAIALKGDAVGDSLYYGRGAGQAPTASSVVSDLVQAAQDHLSETNQPNSFLPYSTDGQLVPIDETSTAYYVRFPVMDRPGVIAEIAKVLADDGLGISGTRSPVDPTDPDADFTEMVFLLHTCPFGKLRQALKKVEALDCLTDSPVVFRIETP